jgi:DMSO/TMAO reductase YedYZ molybdopterin-dependent catalytic subunit
MQEQPERRETLPCHPLSARLTALDDWRPRVDGLVVQRLALSLREVEALRAQAPAADGVCEEGWVVPAQQWDSVAAVPVASGVRPGARRRIAHAALLRQRQGNAALL